MPTPGSPSPIDGFVWVSCGPVFEVQRELPGGGAVRFSSANESKPLLQAADWIATQAARKDRGHLAVVPSLRSRIRQVGADAPAPKPKRKSPDPDGLTAA